MLWYDVRANYRWSVFADVEVLLSLDSSKTYTERNPISAWHATVQGLYVVYLH